MKCRLAVVDARCGENLVEPLHDFAEEVFLFRSEGVTYESVSCHPDIFLYQHEREVVVAPNTPRTLLEKLDELGIPYWVGHSSVGDKLENSCFYNCLSTGTDFFLRDGFADEIILALNASRRKVLLPQSYVRCSMLPLTDRAFITSDAGIRKALVREGYEVFLFSPKEIRIPVHAYGFLGGTCGKLDDKVIFLGNPLKHGDGAGLCRFVEAHGLEVVPLADQFLYDGGALFFFE